MRRYVPPESVEEQWDIPGLETALAADFQMQAPVGEWLKADHELTDDTLRERLVDGRARRSTPSKEAQVGPELMRQFERSLMLQTLDQHWREHLADARPPAPGHPPARLRAEEPEAGVQARGVRALLRHARPHQAGRRQGRAHRAGAHARRTSRRSRRRRRSATSSTSTPTTTRRWRAATADAARRASGAAPFVRARREGRPQRSLPLRLGQEVQAVPRPADLTALRPASATADRRAVPNRYMPVRYTPPARRPAAGPRRRARHRRGEDQELAARRRAARRCSTPAAVAAGVFTQNRFCAAPVTVCRRHLAPASARRRSARSSSTPATPTPAPASAGIADGRADLRGGRVAARLHAAGGAAVLDRRDHGAAAGRPRSSPRCRPRSAALRARPLVRRGVGDHDDRHGAQGRVAARRRRRRRRSPSPASPRAPA